jgi:GntR family transcriptional regulator
MSLRTNLTRSVLYLQIFDNLADRITAGEWQLGRPLPNEIDLAREFGVSGGTMRKALDKLEADRMIERRQGRGTFVLDHRAENLAFRFSRVVDKAGHRVGDRQATLLSQEIDVATSAERETLKLDAGEQVVRTRRLRMHDGCPARHETVCLAKDRLGLTDLASVGDYLVVPLAQSHGVHLSRAVEKISGVEASPEIARLLQVETKKMLLKLDRVIYSADAEPIEWRVAECNLHGEYYVAEM